MSLKVDGLELGNIVLELLVMSEGLRMSSRKADSDVCDATIVSSSFRSLENNRSGKQQTIGQIHELHRKVCVDNRVVVED